MGVESRTAPKSVIIVVCLAAMALIASAQNTAGTISGEIRTPEGTPIVSVRVAALSAEPAGVPALLLSIAQTDSNGRYRLEGVPSGRYYVVAGPIDGPVYHPGTNSVHGATIVSVTGAPVNGVDFAVAFARLMTPDPLSSLFPPPASACPPGPAPPTQPVTAADFVELERTSCFGACPEYTVRISGDGSVTWTGRLNVSVIGAAAATVDAGKARALIEDYRANGFYALCEQDGRSMEDAPGAVSTLRIAGQEKKVTNPPNWAPWLQKELDRLTDTHRWLHGNPATEALGYRTLSGDSRDLIKPGLTPLMQASSELGTVEQVRALLAAKVDPNAQDVSGWTALMYAAMSPDAAIVKTLLDAGANPNARSGLGQTPLMAQVAMADVSTRDAIAPLALLLAAGANINATDNTGQSALMMAIPQSLNLARDDMAPRALARVNLVAFLRDNGARTDLRDALGRTALDLLELEAARTPNHPKAQFERLRLILERPSGAGRPVHVRANLRPRGAEIQQLILQRFGDLVTVTASVDADGSMDFPAVLPGVYSVLMSPPPAFPVSMPPIAISDSASGDIEISVPPMRQVRFTASAPAGEVPVYWLLLTGPSDVTTAWTGGGKPQLIRVGGPVHSSVDSYVLSALPGANPLGLLPSSKSNVVELPKMPGGGYSLMLAEGDYGVTPLLPPARTSWPRDVTPPVTSDRYRMTVTSDGVDLGSHPLRISKPGQEVHVTFTPATPARP